MLKTAKELMTDLGGAIRTRRIAQNWSQEEAARRAGMGVRTWRRLEFGGQATIESLVNAAIALRCEDKLSALFPAPAARNMDELLRQQRAAAEPARPQRVRARKARQS
jgi:transcriptional regulator with XRE-family HTH domain